VRLKRRGRLWVLAALTLGMAAPVPALAQSPGDGAAAAMPVERRPAIASFEGGTIDLAGDWGDATSCLVWRQGGVMECFRTVAELDAREAELAPQRDPAPRRSAGTGGGTVASASASYSCSSSLRLYEHNWYGGRRLSFWDRGYWQNLYLYGFDNQTSSYIVGACYVHLAEHTDGWGWWYPGPTYPYAGEPVMSWGWQDVISSIYIE
jgi:hypothetical protein